MIGPQSGQQLYHSSTQVLHPPSQGEADYISNCVSIIFISATSNQLSWHHSILSRSPGPKPTPKQLLQQLYNTVPDKWYLIGIYLEISEDQLNVIDAKHHGDPQKCLMAMLTESWLP